MLIIYLFHSVIQEIRLLRFVNWSPRLDHDVSLFLNYSFFCDFVPPVFLLLGEFWLGETFDLGQTDKQTDKHVSASINDSE